MTNTESKLIEAQIAAMAPEEKVAQRIMVDLPSPDLNNEIEKFLEQYLWGGAILFPKNIINRAQLIKLTGKLQSINSKNNFPLFIAVDQEGGIVSPLGDLIAPLPGNMAFGAIGDEKHVRDAYGIMARECRGLGFNFLFAPVMDVNNNSSNPVIGARSFGSDPEKVSKLGCAAICGIQKSGLLSTAKHFPGHGDTNVDSHFALPVVPHSLEHLRKTEIVPFQAAISENVSAIMTAHIMFPALDQEYPATLSRRILTDLLRNELGFQGLIVTDSLKMEGVRAKWDLGTAAVLSAKAGADIILSCGDLPDHKIVFNSILDAYQKGELKDENMHSALFRIFSFKQRIRNKMKEITSNDASLQASIEERRYLRELHGVSITVIENKKTLPMVPGEGCIGILYIGNSKGARQLHKAIELHTLVAWVKEFNDEGIRTALNNTVNRVTHLLFVTDTREPLSSEVTKQLERLKDFSIPLIGVSLNNPYHFEKCLQFNTAILSYNSGILSVDAVMDVLFGNREPFGALPIMWGERVASAK